MVWFKWCYQTLPARGETELLLSFHSFSGHLRRFFLEPPHSTETNPAPPRAVYRQAGTTVGGSPDAGLWSQLQVPPAGKGSSSFPCSKTSEISRDKLTGKTLYKSLTLLQAAKSGLGLALIFRSWSPRGDTVWLFSFPVLPMARCNHAEPRGIPSAEERQGNK